MKLAALIEEHKASLNALMQDWKTLTYDTYFKQYGEINPNRLITKLVISNKRYRVRLDIPFDLGQGPSRVTLYSNLIEPLPATSDLEQYPDLHNYLRNNHWIVATGLMTVDCSPITPNELLMHLILHNERLLLTFSP